MERLPKKRYAFFVLIICIYILAIFAGLFIIPDIEHDCKEAICLICLKIETARNILKILKIAGIGFFLAFLSIFITRNTLKFSDSFSNRFLPIELKVRINS
jgi:hypothetical protein